MGVDMPDDASSTTRGRSAGRRTLAQQLDRLFRTVTTEGREFTYREVAAAVEAQTGVSISPSYIWALRTGEKDNPTKRHLEALAAFFRVPAAYFLDDATAEQVDAQLRVLAAMRDAGVQRLALRAQGLSPATLDAIAGMVERARELEGLANDKHDSPADPDSPTSGRPPAD